jgi:23S rRNA (cytosine1962-C5)-methyltransferase
MEDEVQVSRRGADRWEHGHPWIFASDVTKGGEAAGIVAVVDPRGKKIGVALYSPRSEIRLRLLDPRPQAKIDTQWWAARLRAALDRRRAIDATAYRVSHAEGDGLPSLVVDRYSSWIVAQFLSAGLETRRDQILDAIVEVLEPAGILLRNDVGVRRREGLAEAVEEVRGTVPDEIEVREGAIRYLVPPRTGQKTGAFLDQRPNRLRAAALMPAGGLALDCFSYHGSFALHLARIAGRVTALDASAEALERGARNGALNGLDNIEWQEEDAFHALRDFERARRRFHLVVVDPPAFAKTRSAVSPALKGYKEINLRAIRLIEPGGYLVTASCSFHVGWPQFLAMIAAAAADAGRRATIVEHLVQGPDHPEVVTVPETGYLKGVVLRVD